MKEQEARKTYAFAEFQLDTRKRVLLKDGRPLALNSKAFDLLALLVEHGGEVLSKDELLETVWPKQIVEENNLTVQISALRKILGERKDEHRLIVTIPGKGYKFVADIQAPSDQEHASPDEEKEIVIENRTISRVVVEEISEDETPSEKVRSESEGLHRGLKAGSERVNESRAVNISSHPSSFILWSSIGAILLVGLMGLWFWQGTDKAEQRQLKLTKLTTSGKVTSATLTPDGKYAVFAQTEENGESLYLRQIATGSQTRILPPQPVNFIGLTVTPDGNFIYCTTFLKNKADPQLWRVPLLGGATEQIAGVVTGVAVSFSPDAKQIAFTESRSSIKETHLSVAASDGSNKRILIRAPDDLRSFSTFGSNPLAWSPEGNDLACAVEEKSLGGGMKTGILLVNALTGEEKFISERRWDYISHLAWADAENLAFVAYDSDPWQGQVWAISRTTGEARQLTNDLNSYSWLAASASGELLTVQKNTVSHLRVADFDEPAKTLQSREIRNESGHIDNVAWGADGAILYSSSATGKREIWRINADGSSPTQLTVGANITFGLSVSPTDGSLAFCSTNDGKHSLRLADANGKNMRPLIDGTEDVWANFTPDGQSVIFQRGLNNKTLTLWRVAINGGTPIQLTRKPSSHPAVSPDGAQMAYYFMDAESDGEWHIGLISSDTGAIQGKFSFPKFVTERRMRWHPGGRFLTQIFYTGENVNLLLLPTDSSEAVTISGLDKGDVNWFEWARDGKRIVISQTTEIQDVVLLRD
ncbi:MAG: winged helix-turn-helix domain-containing protein, partial [Acidobacteria bacterium]|nr:winged helix-turn-helix domain-containing protein [Acidobacteriota bacterium]